jgi:hypothetical protein
LIDHVGKEAFLAIQTKQEVNLADELKFDF